MRILFFFLFVFSAVFLSAQSSDPTGNIKGNIIDRETKIPLVGVNIYIPDLQIGATTNSDGNYEIKNIPVRIVTIVFSYIGYEAVTKPDIVIKPDKSVFINAEMSSSVLQMNEVVVSGGYFSELENKPVSTANFSSEEIRRSPGAAGDVSRIMYTLPSIAKVNDQRNSLIVRGGTAVENSFYLDNIEIPNINHFPVEGSSDGPIGILNPDFIDNVNFYSGGFSPIYGDRLSSIMEISYREGNKSEISPKIQLNMAGVGGALEGPIADKGNYLISLNKSYLDLIMNQIDEGSPIPKYTDVQGKLVYNLSDKHKLTFLDILSFDNIVSDQQKAIDNNYNMYGKTDGVTNTWGLNLQTIWNEKGYSNISFSHIYTKFDKSYNRTATLEHFYNNNSESSTFKLRNVNYIKIDNYNSAEFGIEVSGNFTKYDTFYGEFDDQYGNTTQPLFVDGRVDNYKYGLFAVHHFNLLDNLRFDYGGRLDYFSYNENLNIAPRASLTYQINPKASFSLSAGLFFQEIPDNILAQSIDFKKLKTPKTSHFVIGFNQEVWDATRLSIEAYYKDYYNFPMNPSDPTMFLFDQIQINGLFWSQQALEDNGRAIAQGVEVMLQKKLAQDFYGLVSASLSNTRYKDYFGKWHNRIYDNQFNFNIEGGYIPGNDWEFKLRWIYAGGAPYTPFDYEASKNAGVGIWNLEKTNDERLPDYHSLSIRVDKRFNFSETSLLIYLSIWNVYGRDNIAYYYWNEITNEVESQTQWTTLPVIGIEYEF